MVLSTINHSELGVMCTNLAIVWRPHIVISNNKHEDHKHSKDNFEDIERYH